MKTYIGNGKKTQARNELKITEREIYPTNNERCRVRAVLGERLPYR